MVQRVGVGVLLGLLSWIVILLPEKLQAFGPVDAAGMVDPSLVTSDGAAM